MNQRATSTAFTVAVAQCASRVGDVAANLDSATRLCARARARGADLILFPESHATGYSYRDLGTLARRTAQPLDGPIGRRLRRLARQFSLVVCCGLFERDHGKIYSAHAVAFPDGRLESQRKAILTRAERTVLRPQRRRRLFVWDGVRFALLVCADNALPDCAAHLRRLDLGLLLHPCAGRFTGNKLPTRKDDRIILRRARDLARELGVAYAVANPVGFSGEDWYAGNSWIMNRRGRLLAHAPSAPSKQRTRDRLAVAPIGKENE